MIRNLFTCRFLIGVFHLWVFAPEPVFAAIPTSEICDVALVNAAKVTGVPENVLQAVTRIETGRRQNGKLMPWPWTVNMEGKGVWFATKDEALAFAYQNYKKGARSFDIGCFQINYKWHGQEFASIDQMFDPSLNALYAAKFLLRLFSESNNWEKAAGAFHSRTKKYASKYETRFAAIRQNLISNPLTPQTPPKVANSKEISLQAGNVPRENSFPFLQTQGSPAILGSLVPIRQSETSRRFIQFGPADG